MITIVETLNAIVEFIEYIIDKYDHNNIDIVKSW